MPLEFRWHELGQSRIPGKAHYCILTGGRQRVGIGRPCCWSQQDSSQWLTAGSAEVSAASSMVLCCFSATNWYHLPVGAGGSSRALGVSGREQRLGIGKGTRKWLCDPSLRSGLLRMYIIAPAHSRLIGQDIEAAGWCRERWKTRWAPDHRTAFGTGPSPARHNYFQQCLSAAET